MNKSEFLRILKESLEMSLEKTAINEQIDYYDKYISDEIKKGKTEKEVIDELGDPRLIAKTIKTVSGSIETKDSNASADSNSDTNYDSNSTYGDKTGGSTNTRYGNGNYRRYVDTSGIGCALAGLVMFIIVMFIFRLFSSMIYGLGDLAFSGPIGFILVLGLLYLFFGGGRRR